VLDDNSYPYSLAKCKIACKITVKDYNFLIIFLIYFFVESFIHLKSPHALEDSWDRQLINDFGGMKII
jgi:hypothetical protein